MFAINIIAVLPLLGWVRLGLEAVIRETRRVVRQRWKAAFLFTGE